MYKKPEPKYDGASDRYWRGDTPLPRSREEAGKMGLHYDPATNAYWNGDTLVARSSDIKKYQRLD